MWELGPVFLSLHLQLISIMRWAVELGMIDIFHQTLLMLQYQPHPCIDQLEDI